MTYDEVLSAVTALLQREGGVAYRVLKRRFSIDDEFIEDLKAVLIDAKHIAADEDNKVLVWSSGQHMVSSQSSVVSSQPQASWTRVIFQGLVPRRFGP